MPDEEFDLYPQAAVGYRESGIDGGPDPLFTSGVTLGKSLNISELPYPHL